MGRGQELPSVSSVNESSCLGITWEHSIPSAGFARGQSALHGLLSGLALPVTHLPSVITSTSGLTGPRNPRGWSYVSAHLPWKNGQIPFQTTPSFIFFFKLLASQAWLGSTLSLECKLIPLLEVAGEPSMPGTDFLSGVITFSCLPLTSNMAEPYSLPALLVRWHQETLPSFVGL